MKSRCKIQQNPIIDKTVQKQILYTIIFYDKNATVTFMVEMEMTLVNGALLIVNFKNNTWTKNDTTKWISCRSQKSLHSLKEKGIK